MNKEEFFNRLSQEVERQMRLRIAMMKLTHFALKTQTKAFETLSNERFEVVIGNN